MKSVHPYKKPMSGPMDSRRKTYCPPARGYMAASSPYESAPSIVMTPAASQASINQRGELTVREISAETMNMPDPIIEPATSIVASVNERALTKPPADAAASPVSGISLIQSPLGWEHRRPARCSGAQIYYLSRGKAS